MGDVVNLRQRRKQQDRDDKQRVAAANRTRFGRSGAERQRDQLTADRLAAQLDGVRREHCPGDEP